MPPPRPQGRTLSAASASTKVGSRPNANWMDYVGCEAGFYAASRSQPKRFFVRERNAQVSRKRVGVPGTEAGRRVKDSKARAV